MFNLVLEKAEEPEIKLPTSIGSSRKLESSRKTSISALLTMPKPLTVFSSVQFSRSVMSDSLWPHESQHARPPCSSPTPGVHSDSRPSSQWCHPAISSFVVPFSSCPQSLPAPESFPVSQLVTWGGQSTGVSALVSFLSKKSQGWSPSEWTGWISLHCPLYIFHITARVNVNWWFTGDPWTAWVWIILGPLILGFFSPVVVLHYSTTQLRLVELEDREEPCLCTVGTYGGPAMSYMQILQRMGPPRVGSRTKLYFHRTFQWFPIKLGEKSKFLNTA